MDWTEILHFSRGPFFHVALIIFAGGMVFRIIRVLFLGWTRDKVKGRGLKTVGVLKTYAKGIVVLPFIPWIRGTFLKNALTYLAGGLFHLSLFAVIFLGAQHMMVWKSLLGFGWTTLPSPVVDGFAVIGIVSLILLLVNRLTHPVLRMITRAPLWLTWTFVFLPMTTGYLMAHHLAFRYEVLFSLHMIAVDILLIWIPISRIPHFLFYFFSRTIHGAQAGKRAVMP